jgi:ubiquinone/menaquinone biosynthesis C-methylase UbiE
MNKPGSDLAFKFMALGFKFRDLLRPRKNVLAEAGISAGFHVLDYGCGPGSYVTAASAMAGETGKIYALDIHPLAIKTVQGIAARKHLSNLETILSDCKTGLPDNSLDIVLLYDTLHSLEDCNSVLEELGRILKPGGILSVSDHHLKEAELVSSVTDKGPFKLLKKGEHTCSFTK